MSLKNIFTGSILMLCCLFGKGQVSNVNCGNLVAEEDVLSCYLEAGNKLFEQGYPDSAWQIFLHLKKYTANFPALEGNRLYYLSLAYMNLSQYDSSRLAALEAARLYEQNQAYDKLIKAYNQVGSGLRDNGKLQESTEYYFKAIDIAREQGIDSLNGTAFMNLAAVFVYLDEPDREMEFILKAYQNAKKYNNQRLMGLSSMGLVQKYRRTAQFDSATFYAQQALESSMALDNQQMVGYSYMNLALIEQDKNNWERCAQYFAEILNNEQIPEFDRARFHYFFGEALLKKGDLQNALWAFKQGYEMVKPLNGINLRHTLASKLYPLYGDLGEFKKGYETAIDYILLTDSIYQVDKEERIQELNTKFETAEKEKALQAKEIELIAKTNQRNSLIGLTIGLLIISGLVFFGFLRRLQLNQRLRKQEVEIAEQQVRELQQEQKYLAIQSMVAGEEAERSRLARELHDGLGGMLSNLKLTLSAHFREQMKKEGQNPIAIVDKASMELRRIAQNLMPESLARFGLIQALEDLANDVEHSTNLQIDFQHYNIEEPLPDNLTLPVYRIIQELIHNVVKHADATEILVQLIQRQTILHLTVEDNGIGLAWDQAVDKGGQGLKNIQTRLAFLKGELQVDSQAGKGTTITIEIGIPTANDKVIHY